MDNFLYERISLFALEFKLESTVSASNKRLSREAVEAPWCSFTFPVFFFSLVNPSFVSQRLPIPRVYALSNITYQTFNVNRVYLKREHLLLLCALYTM